jgi:hypothetical protein
VSGVVPLCAAVLLALARPRERAARAAAAYALALALLAAVEVGVFAAGHAGRLLERELFFVLPALLVAFAAWLERDDGRRGIATAAVAAAELAALLAMPFGRLARAAAVPDNPSLVPLSHLDSPKVYGVVALVALGAAAALVWARGRHNWLLPALLLPLLVGASVSASEEFGDRAQAARALRAAPQAGWVDRSAPAAAAYVYDGVSSPELAWTQLYWNDRIRSVYDLTGSRIPGPLPQAELLVPGDDGALRLVGGAPAPAGVLVAPAGFAFRGTRLADAPALGLALSRVGAPARIRTWAQGLEPNGDLPQGGVATLDVFDCGRGAFQVVAVGRDNETLKLARDGNPVAETDLWPQGVWEQTIQTPARPRGSRCSFSLTSSSLVHLQTFRWSPAGR